MYPELLFNGEARTSRANSRQKSSLTDTAESQGGAPVWLWFPNSGKRYLVAVHSGSCHEALDGCKPSRTSRPTSNMGVLLTTAVEDQIEAWKKTM